MNTRRLLGYRPDQVMEWKLPEPVVIPPGESRTFEVDMTTPPTSTRYVWTWNAWGLLWWR